MPKKTTKKNPPTPQLEATVPKKPPTPQVEATVTRCLRCGSTDREAYSGTVVQEFSGILPDGQPYTHIVRRRTRCRACGQCRVDRAYENRATDGLDY